MTDIDSGAAQGNNGAVNPEDAPQFRVLAQYIKDLSFENPGAPGSLRKSDEQPKTDVSIDVQARRGTEDEYEAEIKLNVSSKRGDETLFIIELVYAGVFVIKNIPEESLQPVLLIECPRLLFPFARNILANVARDGGFPPLMLDPIDFATLYRQQLAAAQAEAGQA
ncbi:MAG: protein-export chaperone SecB [Alphaproteobacteria bacterium]|nr:MAG: protein-export chaperone SecB [Alphaproteobacteria bacterium]